MPTLDSFHCSHTLIVQFQHATNCSKLTVKLEKRCETCSKLTIKTPKQVIDIVLVSSLLTLNIFHIFFYCLYCWLWTGHYLLGMTVKFVIFLCRSVSFDQRHTIHWRKLKKLVGKCYPKLHGFFYKKNFYIRKWASNIPKP